MLFNFNQLVRKHNIVFKGVIHVGAHECGEIYNYGEHGIDNGILIEANPDRYLRLVDTLRLSRYPISCYPLKYAQLPDNFADHIKNYKAYNYIVCDVDGESKELNLSTFDGGVDSIFKINRFGQESSWINYEHVKTVSVDIITLDTLVQEPEKFNFLNIDVEGAELLVLKGATKLLQSNIDYIMVETQEKSRFDGSCLHGEIESYLEKFGFKQVDYLDTGKLWGDALFSKVNNEKHS